jgi:uroporphyrinogen-III synthase
VTGTLTGLTIIVTRPAAQAGRFIERATAAGARCIAFPTLAIEKLVIDPATIDGVRSRRWHWAVFTSTNAVECAFEQLSPPIASRTAAVGRATARSLESRGISVDARPESANSEGLLALPEFADLRGQGVLLVKGSGGRELLQEELRARGAELLVLEVYRRALAAPAADARSSLHEALLRDADRVVAATSAEVLEALVQLTPAGDIEALQASRLLVPGPRVAAAASRLGWKGPVLQAPTAEDDAMIAALITQLPGQRSNA